MQSAFAIAGVDAQELQNEGTSSFGAWAIYVSCALSALCIFIFAHAGNSVCKALTSPQLEDMWQRHWKTRMWICVWLELQCRVVICLVLSAGEKHYSRTLCGPEWVSLFRLGSVGCLTGKLQKCVPFGRFQRPLEAPSLNGPGAASELTNYRTSQIRKQCFQGCLFCGDKAVNGSPGAHILRPGNFSRP